MNDISLEKITFESIKFDYSGKGSECWTAREVMPLLGYTDWRKFIGVIEKAKIACKKSNQRPEDHFVGSDKMVTIGSGSQRVIEDYILTRYACYLIAQNGDPRKPEIARAQTYFAIQTFRQEQFDKLPEDEKRLYMREEVVNNNKILNTSAKQHGVSNYGYFHNEGYKGLYGMSYGDIIRRKALGKDKLLDRAGSSELAANLFRITQTDERLKKHLQEGRKLGERNAARLHNMVGGKVRQTIKDIGGVLPENLPAVENIKHLQSQMNKDNKALPKPAEKPLKIKVGFEKAIDAIANTEVEDKSD